MLVSSVVVSAVISRQLSVFGKVAASWKVYGKLTNNCKQFVNAFVADERRCSPSLPLQQAKKLADAAWKAADHGKDEVVVSDVLSSSANGDECVMISFIVPVPKFPSDVLTLKYTLLLLRQQTLQYSGVRKSAICVRMGEAGHTYVKDITFRKKVQAYEMAPKTLGMCTKHGLWLLVMCGHTSAIRQYPGVTLPEC